MPNYQNGKIYQVISPNHPVPYIGSTTQPLCKRMAGHRKPSNGCSSRTVIDAGDAYIELIEEFPCETKEQLNKREGEIIRERECVNRVVAGRTQAEYGKEYYQENKEAIAERRRQRFQVNKEAIAEQRKQYYQANKEARAELGKRYYQANKEAIAEYQKQYRAKKKAQQTHTEHTVTDLPQELEHSS